MANRCEYSTLICKMPLAFVVAGFQSGVGGMASAYGPVPPRRCIAASNNSGTIAARSAPTIAGREARCDRANFALEGGVVDAPPDHAEARRIFEERCRHFAAQLGVRTAVVEVEREAALANLRALQAQIEPHFLFNTLANVQQLVESGSPRAAPGFRSLIDYLRAALPQLQQQRVDVAPREHDHRGRLEGGRVVEHRSDGVGLADNRGDLIANGDDFSLRTVRMAAPATAIPWRLVETPPTSAPNDRAMDEERHGPNPPKW